VDRFCVKRQIGAYSPGVVVLFEAEQDARLAEGLISRGEHRALTKTAGLLADFGAAGQVRWAVRRGFMPPVDPIFAGALEEYESSLEGILATGSISSLTGEARRFLTWLTGRGHAELGSVTAEDVRGYLVDVAPKHPSGMGGVTSALTRLFGFFNARGWCDLNVTSMLAPVGPRRQRALPAFTHQEVAQLLEAIDTRTARGKRDHAMVLLAVQTGLRGCDIARLRLEDIDWRRDEIRIVQSKTGQPLTLPLSAPVGNAIADWLLNARPDSAAPEVFTRLNAPFRELAGSPGKSLMARWLGLSGINREPCDGKTFHGLRRSTGTWLIESGADAELASQVLGHSSIDSARAYIRLADDLLRGCCLPLIGLETTVGELR